MVDDSVPTFPHLLAALDTFLTRLGAELGARADAIGVRFRGSHGRILHLLAPEGTRPARLAEGWISKQAIGKRIRELVELGLVEVVADPADRRATLVRRTPEGDAVIGRAWAAIHEIEAQLRADVGEERWEVFRGVLDELAWPWAPPLLHERLRDGSGS